MTVLDKSGLAYLWSKIKAYILKEVDNGIDTAVAEAEAASASKPNIVAKDFSATSVTSSVWTKLGTITLAKGTFYGGIYGYCPAFADGMISLALSTTSSSIDTSKRATMGSHSKIVNRIAVPLAFEVESTTTFYVWAYQNSGSAKNIGASISLVKLT